VFPLDVRRAFESNVAAAAVVVNDHSGSHEV
jgi:hypothetical protein